MKKLLSLIMVLMMILSLAACGGASSEASNAPEVEAETEVIIPATIIDNEGNEVQMTADELRAVEEENAAKFKQLYKNAEITITGTVESVDAYQMKFGSNNKNVYYVNLEEGWRAIVLQELHGEVIDLSRGDKVEIKSLLRYCGATHMEVYEIGQLGSEWTDKTVITVL